MLGFPSLASRLVEAQCGWGMWHYHVELKLKTMGRCDGLHGTLLPQLCHFHFTSPSEHFSLLVCCLGL
jgi:hypothetical protein